MDKQNQLEFLYSKYSNFIYSDLYIKGSQSIVFGEGNSNSPIVFVGEAPGAEEELQKRPFVGRSGKLLNKTIEMFYIKRADVFITNIVKCRPLDNRTPSVEEIIIGRNCLLSQELHILAPKLIVTVGLIPTKGLCDDFTITMGSMRGKIHHTVYGNIFPIYHPAYILRNPSAFDIFYADIKKALEIVGLINKK